MSFNGTRLIHTNKPSAVTRQPKMLRSVFDNIPQVHGCAFFLIKIGNQKSFKAMVMRTVTIQSFFSRNPQIVFVFIKTMYVIIRKSIRVFFYIGEILKMIAIVTMQAPIGTDPQKAKLIFM